MEPLNRLRLDDLTLDELRRRRSSKWTHYPQDVIPAWVAEMDFPLADPVRRAVIAAAERSDFGYAPYREDDDIGDTFSAWAARSFGWEVDPGHVVAVPDVVHGMKVAIEVLTKPGDGVVVQPPVYPPFFSVVKETGRRLVENPLIQGPDRYELDLGGLDDALGSAATLLLCHPQNPTGRCFSREELGAIARLLEKHDVTVISDEIHSPLTLPGATHVPFATLSDEIAHRTMTVTSAAKAWNIAGLKCGFIVGGSTPMTDRVTSRDHIALGNPSILGLEATRAALTEGRPWLDEVLTYVAGTSRLVSKLLGERLPEVGYFEPEATYFAWLDCRRLSLPADPFTFFLEEAKVALSNGERFGRRGEGFLRLNLATSQRIVTEIIDRMAEAVERHRSPG